MNSWANLGFDLHIELPQGIGVRTALLQTLRDAIDSGLLKPGTRLPPSRTLAVDLGVARNTVADCYAELAAAGWLVTRPGSGTVVATLASTHSHEVEPSPTRRRLTHSLLPGSPDASAFPRTAWISSARRALITAPTDAFATTDPRGRVELRNALTTYLSRTRGVRVDPNRIVISASSGHGISLLARALGGTIAVDAFCLHLHRQLLVDEGLLTIPISVDESGTCTDELVSTSAESVLLTPTHQFPSEAPSHRRGARPLSNGPRLPAASSSRTTMTANSVTTESLSAHSKELRRSTLRTWALSARHCRRPFASDGWCCRTG